MMSDQAELGTLLPVTSWIHQHQREQLEKDRKDENIRIGGRTKRFVLKSRHYVNYKVGAAPV